MRLAGDPRYVGGTIAVLCVLHTWTRAMVYHPHVHCLVPGGGLADDGRSWLPTRKRFLVPVRALSAIFRAKFMDLLRSALPNETLPGTVWDTNWVVYSKSCVRGSERVLAYLARYVHRIAITNNRILSFENGEVTFRYKDSRDNRWKTMKLSAGEFMRRFLQHVLPHGFHKVRSYGLLAPANRERLHRIRNSLVAEGAEPKNIDDHTSHAKVLPAEQKSSRCPHCLTGTLVVIFWLPYRRRAPP